MLKQLSWGIDRVRWELSEAPFQIALVGIVMETVGMLYTVYLDTLR